MPFNIKNMQVIAYAESGFTLWHYRHTGSLSDVIAPLFWSNAADMLAPADRIMITGPDGALDLHVISDRDGVRVIGLQGTPAISEGV